MCSNGELAPCECDDMLSYTLSPSDPSSDKASGDGIRGPTIGVSVGEMYDDSSSSARPRTRRRLPPAVGLGPLFVARSGLEMIGTDPARFAVRPARLCRRELFDDRGDPPGTGCAFWVDVDAMDPAADRDLAASSRAPTPSALLVRPGVPYPTSRSILPRSLPYAGGGASVPVIGARPHFFTFASMKTNPA